MNIKRIIALMLAVVLMAALFTGCNKTVDEVIDNTENSGENGETTDTAENGEAASASSRDYGLARMTYPADELVMTIGDEEISWDEFFNWICYSVTNYEYTYGGITDFSAEATLGGTIKDTVLNDAKYYLTLYREIERHAAEMGIDYPEDIDETVQSELDSTLEYYEGDAVKLGEYINSTFGSRENCEYIMRIDSLYDAIFKELYGEDGANLTDEQIEAGTEGMLMAKHILIKTVNDDNSALSDEEKAAALEKIQGIKDQLDNYDGDDLEGYFDELMQEYSEDPGSQSSPDGYLFQEGDMVTEFYEGTKNIEIGEISDIIETSYGYHIIMRLPINLESTPSSYSRYGYTYSMRYIIASQLFRSTFQSWVEEADVETTEFYDTIDLIKVFPAIEVAEQETDVEEPAVEQPVVDEPVGEEVGEEQVNEEAPAEEAIEEQPVENETVTEDGGEITDEGETAAPQE